MKGKVSRKKGEARMSPHHPTTSIITKQMVPLLHIFWSETNFSHAHGFTAITCTQLSHSTQLFYSTIEFSLIIMVIFMNWHWLSQNSLEEKNTSNFSFFFFTFWFPFSKMVFILKILVNWKCAYQIFFLKYF